MFAPRVATSQTRGDAGSIARFGQRTSRQAGNERDGEREREIVRENLTDPAAPSHLAWDFGKIPLFPPDRTSRSQASYPLPGIIQRKLTMGAVNDPLEHEADRVADQVMRMPDPGIVVNPAPPQISRKCEACEDEEETLQRKETGTVEPGLSDAPASVHEVLRSPGQPLDEATRAYFEPRFGRDFSGVRIHSDAKAARSVAEVNARAYTVGSHMVLGAGAHGPTSNPGRRLLAHELTHVMQQLARNGMHLQRAPAGGNDPTASVPRQVVVIDASIIGEINRGNVDAAHALRNFVDTATVYIPLQQYRELTAQPGKMIAGVGPDLPRTAAANKQLISDLHIRIAPAGDTAKYAEVLEANRRAGNTISATDIEVAAAAKANNGKVWSLDKSYVRPNLAALEKVLGVKIAPETHSVTVPASHPREDYRQARASLGLKPLDVSVGGIASGEINTGSPGSSEGGGTKPATNTTAQPAEIVTPIEAPHASGGQSIHAAAEFGAIALLSAQLDAVRAAEKQKAIDRLNELAPQIEDWRQKGRGVTVTLVVEVPDQVDIAAIWAGIGDASQVVYFKKMYISSITRAPQSPSSSGQQGPAYVANDAPGDPDSYDPHDLPLDAQIRMQMGEKYPIPELRPKAGFHFASRDLQLPAYPSATSAGQPGGRGLAGHYVPVAVKLYREGSPKNIQTYGISRSLLVSIGQLNLDLTMVDLNDHRPYTDKGLTIGIGEGQGLFSRTFEKNRGTVHNYVIQSRFSYKKTKDFDVLIEDAAGEDLDPQWRMGSKWRATIVWGKL
jgi:predicted nucleic acid-binding protein